MDYCQSIRGRRAELEGSKWQLLRGDQVVGGLVVYGGDFPWVNALLLPKEGFEEIRSLFEEEMRSLDAYDEDIEGSENAYRRVWAAVSLAAPDGHLVREFILHIDGIKAWWRWTDEPFEDEGAPSPLAGSICSSALQRARLVQRLSAA